MIENVASDVYACLRGRRDVDIDFFEKPPKPTFLKGFPHISTSDLGNPLKVCCDTPRDESVKLNDFRCS